MVPSTVEAIQKMTKHISAHVHEELNCDFIADCTMEIIVEVAFGKSFDHVWLAAKFKELMGLLTTVIIYSNIFGSTLIKYLPLPEYRKRTKLRKEIELRVAEEINKRRQLKGSASLDETKDLLTLLVNASEEVDNTTIVDNGLTFLFAGIIF